MQMTGDNFIEKYQPVILTFWELWSHRYKDKVITQLSSQDIKYPRKIGADISKCECCDFMLWIYGKYLNRLYKIWFQFSKSSLEQAQTSCLKQNIMN